MVDYWALDPRFFSQAKRKERVIMTNIDTLEAGPELDALVAEKVMGERRHHDWRIDGYPGDLDTWEACEECGLARKDFVEGTFCDPPFSSDIAAAWLVVDKFRLERKMMDIFPSPRGYDVEIFPGHFETAATAPLAICLAALKAVGA